MKNAKAEIEKILNELGKLKLSEISPELIERGKKYINELDLSKVEFSGGKVTRFDEITNSIEMMRFLSSRSKIKDLSEEYISHYTNYDVAKKIVSSRKIRLGNPKNMNDGLEFSSPKMDSSKLYFASFSIENGENIGMWSMYGQPWENGIKISIPKKLFLSWTEKIKKVYCIDSKTNETITNEPLVEGMFKPSISRVAYIEWDNNGKVSFIRCGNTKNYKVKDIDSPIFMGQIKDAAWSYEKEIRLRVDLGNRIAGAQVAIEIPDEIMNSIVITTGPRFKNSISNEQFKDVADIRKSIFAGKLNYVYCDRCSR